MVISVTFSLLLLCELAFRLQPRVAMFLKSGEIGFFEAPTDGIQHYLFIYHYLYLFVRSTLDTI